MARGLWQETERLLEAILAIIPEQAPLTVRQCFYRLVVACVVENAVREYKRVSRVVTLGRERDLISWDDVVDRSRPSYEPSTVPSLYRASRQLLQQLRRDRWQDQPRHVELWLEKDALVGPIQQTCDDLGIVIHVLRGFASATIAHTAAGRFADAKKPVTVLYSGDHDPSGRVIESELAARVKRYGAPKFTVKRLAILPGDIRRFHLPPLRIKMTDSRAAGFLRRYGPNTIELDALPPAELRRRITAATESLIEPGAWRRAEMVERAQRETTERVVAKLEGLERATP